MTAKFLSAQPEPAVRQAAPLSQRTQNLAQIFSTLKHLERTVAACEVLADELGPETYTHPLHEHINEVIVSCEQMIGSLVRQSRFSMQYAEVCVSACANLANECVHAEARTALHCAQLCSDTIDLLRDDFAVALAN
jgi:hypothetical protein